MAEAAGLYGRLNRTSTRGFLAYVAACAACAAVLACFVISSAKPATLRLSSRSAPVWPVSRLLFGLVSCHPPRTLGFCFSTDLLSFISVGELQDLEFNWRLVVATIVGFLGSAFGTVGGIGGGGIFVPLLNLVLGFDTKSAAALSKCKPAHV